MSHSTVAHAARLYRELFDAQDRVAALQTDLAGLHLTAAEAERAFMLAKDDEAFTPPADPFAGLPTA